MWSNNSAPRHLPRELKIGFHTNPCMHVHSTTSHNCQKVEITQVSISRWMDKQNAAQPYNEILLSHKKKWSGEFPGSWWRFQALTAGLDSIPGLGPKISRILQYRQKKKERKKEMKVWYALQRGWSSKTPSWVSLPKNRHKGHILYDPIYMKCPGKSIETEGRLTVAWGWGSGNEGD